MKEYSNLEGVYYWFMTCIGIGWFMPSVLMYHAACNWRYAMETLWCKHRHELSLEQVKELNEMLNNS